MRSISSVRSDFPLLNRKIHGKPITYLDSAATSLRPMSVIDAERRYYETYSANVFRGIYTLSEEATDAYEKSRRDVASFIGAPNESEVIFVRNTTEALNLVAYGMKDQFSEGDHIVTTILEHHSNFVPWQVVGKEKRLHFDVLGYITSTNEFINELQKKLTKRTKLVTFTAASNVTGLRVDVPKIVSTIRALAPDSLIIVDAAQYVPHVTLDVTSWGADAIAFSGHKMMGPTGIGVLWVSKKCGENLSPFLFGGEMIEEVYTHSTTYKPLPHRFEAGTPHIAGAIGLGAAIGYLSEVGMKEIEEHEKTITTYALKLLRDVEGLHILGPEDGCERGGVIAWTMDDLHPHDCAQILDTMNICVRAGMHCAQPLHEYFKIAASVRASFYVYTTKEDIDALMQGLGKVKKTLKG